jgi:hypothetical protein
VDTVSNENAYFMVVKATPQAAKAGGPAAAKGDESGPAN